MIRTLASFFTRIVQRWMPDTFVFAVLLTAIVWICGVVFEQRAPLEMVRFWGDGLWDLLGFSMQMVLILVTGHVLASSPPVRRVLARLAGLPSTPGQAVMLCTVIAVLCFWINWGFGLVASAIVAREIATRVRGTHYPLLVASAYSGMVIWHAGLSGSIPLKIASDDGDSLSALMNGHIIPVADTIFSLPVLLLCGAVLLTLPVLNRLMMPEPGKCKALPEKSVAATADPVIPGRQVMTPAQRCENSPLVSLLLVALGGCYLVLAFQDGAGVGLNTVNLLFLVLGLLLHGSPMRYLAALQQAITGVAGIVLQFPLYAGIMGMVVGSGLAVSVSQWFVAVSTPATFPLLTFLSAGLVNFFVPSGGGQWAVQAPIVIPAAESLGVPLEHAAMAVAFGDGWTNMIQPFWALPLLAVAGLGIRDIMGYCTVVLLWTGLLMGLGMVLLF